MEGRLGKTIARAAAAAALVALLAPWTPAEEEGEPASGFEPGQRTFTNPFADVEAEEEALPPEPDEFNDTGADIQNRRDDVERRREPPRVGGSGGAGRGRPGEPEKDVPAPKFTDAGVEVGGDKGGGVISHAAKQPGFIDPEMPASEKEVITDFSYPDVDILDLAKTMGKLTGKNFIVDKDVKGRITIISNSPITVGDAWKAFLTSMDVNGFTLIPSGAYIRIARHRDARDKQIRTYVGANSPDTDQLITKVIPLKHISAEEVARVYRNFMAPNSRIIPYAQTNTVIVTDTGSNIRKLEKMTEFLDVEGYDAGIEVISVKYGSAEDLAKLIDTLIPGQATADKSRATVVRRTTGFQSRRTKGGGVINTIIADGRTNTLIVHANTEGARQVRDLVTQLDKKISTPAGGGKIHVLYLQFADAEDIATTLNNLSSAAAQQPKKETKEGGIGVNPTQTVLFEGAIRVSADKTTNSLVITASPADFAVIQAVISKLDIPRDEVYVEVVIMEMGLDNGFQYSSNAALPTSGISLSPNGDLLQFIQNPVSQNGAVLGWAAGKSTTINIGGSSFPVSSVQGLVKLLQTNSKANVLATPQILTLDNKEATFETSERIPVQTTSAVQGAVTTGITKEPVSLRIVIKPQINKISNFVKLDIKTKLEDISERPPPANLIGQAFVTLDRSIDTSIVVADKDTVVLGGLIRDKQTEAVNKIPILGDIPLLGWLFKSKQSTVTKTNLVMFITPKIIRKYESIRALLDKKLLQRDKFLEKHAGGDDPMRDYRDEMIRELPDMKEIMDYKPEKSSTVGAGGRTDDDEPEGYPFTGGQGERK